MEEEVTEPDPQTVELTGMPLPPGTHSEVNGDLPGNPYLRDEMEDVMESPAREPVVLQYPAEYSQSHQYGEKMPFHHVTAGLLYKGNYLSRSLSDSDSDVLASISVEELHEIREAFKVLDRDGNGFISKQELGMAMRSLGYMPSEVELAIIMQRLDMDGDGQVDFNEFMTILGPKLLSSETREGFLGSTIDTIFWQQLMPPGVDRDKNSAARDSVFSRRCMEEAC
ncbi:calcium-binding protein 8-like [Micropterus dolomieu]|uniref:calcium-binding protein 8-like n=1 Tax=Micropterus dolomieu TaxID=147949 RepID=UPI001E8E748B|nr:calcium-binding protein 8-like [Micropterus dolomieu]